MALTVVEVLAIIAPQFNSLAPAVLDYYAEQAEGQTSECQFGDDYTHAAANLAAHMLSLRSRGGVGGQVVGMYEGDLQITYGTITSTDTLLTTSYGQEYNRLRQAHIIPLRVAFNTVACSG